jgi:hypothetical protein
VKEDRKRRVRRRERKERKGKRKQEETQEGLWLVDGWTRVLGFLWYGMVCLVRVVRAVLRVCRHIGGGVILGYLGHGSYGIIGDWYRPLLQCPDRILGTTTNQQPPARSGG